MPAVIAKSCKKILIGKTYWKNAALPSIMHGTEIACFTKNGSHTYKQKKIKPSVTL